MNAEGHAGFPPQHQDVQPGKQTHMEPAPLETAEWYKGSGKLRGKVAIITGGDSGIGRSVAILFAREGADVSIVYYNEHEDANRAKDLVENEGAKCLLMAGDVQDPSFCRTAVESTVREMGRLDILVNNAACQPMQNDMVKLSDDEIDKTFRTNVHSFYYITREALKHLKKGASIINTTSVTAYMGHPELLVYSVTKGAIVTFTRSLALNLVERGIRVNAVAPGPIWTPLIPASFPSKYVEQFGTNFPMGRAGQPEEVAPCYVFLAARDSSYMTGQVLHPNGGKIING